MGKIAGGTRREAIKSSVLSTLSVSEMPNSEDSSISLKFNRWVWAGDRTLGIAAVRWHLKL